MIRTTLAALATATALALPVAAQDADIVDTAVAAGTFETLVAAVQAAGLVDTLKGEGPFTVFAPTDAALTALLTYHVVPGNVMSTDLSDGMMATTVQGSDVTIGTEGGVTVNGANVVTADIETSNGVIHVIDAVILPDM